ncbi:MAG: DUF805 domain-containing protein [Elusimicrobia bacterium]|nr:DUF805 domain-containing protein [Elusimicrobiota bacterium]
MSFRLRRLPYAMTALPALIGAFVIAGLIQMGEVTSAWAGLASLALLAGAFAGAAARFRDIGRSPWWALVILAPVIGPMTALVLAFWPGKPEDPTGTEGSAASGG